MLVQLKSPLTNIQVVGCTLLNFHRQRSMAL